MWNAIEHKIKVRHNAYLFLICFLYCTVASFNPFRIRLGKCKINTFDEIFAALKVKSNPPTPAARRISLAARQISSRQVFHHAICKQIHWGRRYIPRHVRQDGFNWKTQSNNSTGFFMVGIWQTKMNLYFMLLDNQPLIRHTILGIMFCFKFATFVVVVFVTIPIPSNNVIFKYFQVFFHLRIEEYITATFFPQNVEIFI